MPTKTVDSTFNCYSEHFVWEINLKVNLSIIIVRKTMNFEEALEKIDLEKCNGWKNKLMQKNDTWDLVIFTPK